MNGRDRRISVFQDTGRLCRSHPRLKEAIAQANRKQEVIHSETDLPVGKPPYDVPAEIVLSGKRSFAAAAAYKGSAVCVLNFASARHPGGGVERGASAQEECLCRTSTLFFHLTDEVPREEFYQRHGSYVNQRFKAEYNDDCIYTPGVTVFKTDTLFPEQMPERDWFSVNVISCAAPNLCGPVWDRIGPDDLQEIHEKRLRRILSVAAAHNNEVVILGAFGCGAFRNPPEIVAAATKRVVEEFRYHFKTIEIAVWCPPGNDTNYRAFQQVLGI